MTRNNIPKNDKKPGQIFAVGLIRNLIAAGHARAVTDGLAALREFDPDAVANFTDTLLAPWLSACAETPASRGDYIAALQAKRPWLVLSLADKVAEEANQPKAAARREYFSMLIRRESTTP